MNEKKILIVDDEKPIVDILKFNLEKEGFSTAVAYDGEEAINLALSIKPDLILLDLMLPKVDGFNVCKELRKSLVCPIIMLTAKEEVVDKIIGLELGADDYITKPFSVRELMARIKANLRKLEPKTDIPTIEDDTEKETEQTINIGNLVLDLEKIEARIDGKSIDITLKEFEFLKYLALKHGQAVTREELLKNVWEYDYIGDERTVDVLVRRLRKKIKDDTTSPKILATKRGIGYYLKTDYPDKQRKD